MAKQHSRRKFIKCAGLATAAAGALAAGLPAHAQEEGQNGGEKFWRARLGKIKDLNEKEPTLVKAQFLDSEGRVMDEEKVFVRWEAVNKDAGRWIVLSAVCQHLKCIVEFSEGSGIFICPCHGSRYDLEGEVLAKPTRKPLPDYSGMAEEQDGELYLKRKPS
jgi:Rieske Fe-S protein